MIIEDYVSFECAKLLKEKGFDETCEMFYCKPHEGYLKNRKCDKWRNSDLRKDITCTCPTNQMAMKWLREVHNIHITIDCDICDSFDFYSIIRIKSEESWKTYVEYEDEGSNTCEEAAEKAVKYCLTNLI